MRAKETLEEKQAVVQEIKSVSGEKFREYCEDISARTEWKREYHLEGVRKRIVLSSNSGEYRDENGDWKAADNSLERQETDGEGFTGYATRQGGYQVRFPVNAKQAVLMQIREGESRVSFRLKERCRTASGRLASRKGTVENYVRASMDGERKCSGIGYRNIFPKADVKYDLENGKIKERIVVKEPQANYRYEFCIDTENAEVRKDEETGILRIYNGEKELFHIPEAYMEDANGEVSNAVEYELKEESAGRYTFAIVADAAWMNDEERAYPVVIDPTLIKESGVSCHCVGKTTKPKYNSTGSPCGYQTVYSTETTNRVGKSGDTIYRTYINFALLSEFEYDVTNAILRLELSSNAGGEYYVGPATSKSSATQIFIGNVPVRDVLTLKTEQNNGKTVYTASADITAIVRDWMNGGKNYGVELRGNESVNACIEIVSAQVLFTTQHQRAKASNSFQKNDAKRAGKSAVDLYSGRLMFEHSDFEFLSEMFPMKISHEYNSDLYYRNGPGMKLGYGWKLNLQQNISTLAAPSGFSSSGGTVYMYEDGNGVWHEISCKKYNLEKQKSNYEGSATRTVKRYTEEGQSTEMSTKEGLMLDTSNMMLYENNGVMSYFQHIESGVRYLTRTVYADKKQLNDIKKELNITYSGNKITKVTDGAGKTAQFAYNSSNYLTSITCEGKKISFSYTGDDLTKIVYPDNTFTTFAYDENHLLTKVTDRSGYELRFEYGSGWYGYGYAVTRISELTAYETIGNGWKTPHCCNAILSGDSWSIHHSHSLQTQVKNRNGLTLEYIFDVDGNTVTMFEDDRAPTSLDKFNITGKANFRRSYLMEEKSAVTNGYKTRTQTIEAVMYNRENHLSAVENWVPTGMTYGDGTSSEAYVEGGRSYKVEGSLNAFKRLQTTLPAGVHENGIYVFGCWAKAENVIASVDTEYGNGNGRYLPQGYILKRAQTVYGDFLLRRRNERRADGALRIRGGFDQVHRRRACKDVDCEIRLCVQRLGQRHDDDIRRHRDKRSVYQDGTQLYGNLLRSEQRSLRGHQYVALRQHHRPHHGRGGICMGQLVSVGRQRRLLRACSAERDRGSGRRRSAARTRSGRYGALRQPRYGRL